jgi:hypothetical protein
LQYRTVGYTELTRLQVTTYKDPAFYNDFFLQ